MNKTFLLRRKRVAIGTAGFALVLIGISWAFLFWKDAQSSSNSQQVATPIAKTKEKEVSAPPEVTKEVGDEVVDQPGEQQAPTKPATVPIGQKPSGGVVVAPTPPAEPFRVNSVSLQNPYILCGGSDSIFMVIPSATVSTNSGGGTITWQVEVGGTDYLGENDYVVYPRQTTISPGQYFRTLYEQDPNNPSSLAIVAHSHTKTVRVHVTSPNSVASPWFTVTPQNSTHCN